MKPCFEHGCTTAPTQSIDGVALCDFHAKRVASDMRILKAGSKTDDKLKLTFKSDGLVEAKLVPHPNRDALGNIKHVHEGNVVQDKACTCEETHLGSQPHVHAIGLVHADGSIQKFSKEWVIPASAWNPTCSCGKEAVDGTELCVECTARFRKQLDADLDREYGDPENGDYIFDVMEPD